MKKIGTIGIVCLLAILVSTSSLFAQGITTAALNGIVADKNGQALPLANVTAVHVPTGSVSGISTRDDGRYNIPGLRVGGPYTITAKLVGYKAATKTGVMLALGDNLRLDFTLVEESVQMGEVAVVGERGSIISQARTGAATNVAKEAIERLPTITRSFQDFQRIAPQFIGNNAAGRNNRFNNIQIDGANINDLFGLGSSGTPGGQASTQPISLDALQEFQVLIAPFDVRQSGFTGGGVNAITRSGSNEYTGSVFAFGRNQNQTGLSVRDPRTKVAEFSDFQLGFRAGGPAIQDKLFFFVNGEIDRRLAPSDISLKGQLALTGSNVSPIPVDSAALFASTLRSKYGYDPGTYDPYKYQRDSKKLFLRFDYNISDKHRLTIRHNLVDAFDDNLTRTTASFFMSNTSYRFNSTTNQTVAQLTSTFSNEFANEAIVGYTRIRDSRDFAGSPFPFVQINSHTGAAGTLAAGSENFSVANRLDQDIFEVTDNFTWFNGAHTITAGTHNEFYQFANLFIRNLYGYYEFSSVGAFVAGQASRYQYSYSTTGDPKWAASFSAIQPGFYIQDEWQITPNFKLTGGVRVDIPILPDSPSKNPYVDSVWTGAYETSQIASGNLLWSPRLGFNWDVNKDKTTQVRGGVGIFSGRIPYVWISNQYGNTGNELGRIDFRPAAGGSFPFNPDPNGQPLSGPGLAPVKSSEVDITDPNFKMPQLMRFNVGLDRQLPIFDLIGTLDFMYSQNLNDIVYQDVNIQPNGKYSTYDGRPWSGDTAGNRGTTSWTVNKRDAAHFTNVILMKNSSDGYQWNVTAQLQRPLRDGLFGSIAYTYGRAKDRNSVVSSQAYSQWRFNPIPGNPNDPPLAYSNFDRPHRIVASISYQHEWLQNAPTTISLIYTGYSGEPYSYIYNGDVNGDGETSNDLLYVPKNAQDIVLTTNNYAALDAFIQSDDYLSSNRGKIVPRNEGRNPWVAHVDLHLGQQIPIPTLQGHNLEITLDVLNIMNLISQYMGRERFVPNQTYQLLTYQGIDSATRRPKFSFSTPAFGVPWQYSDLASRWQAQLGVRYSF